MCLRVCEKRIEMKNKKRFEWKLITTKKYFHIEQNEKINILSLIGLKTKQKVKTIDLLIHNRKTESKTISIKILNFMLTDRENKNT